jgi:sortase A
MKLSGFERIFRTLGIGLVLLYLCARLYSLVLPSIDLWAFQTRQSVPHPVATLDAHQNITSVDFTLWSPGRIREYKQSLASRIDPPIAVLAIARIGILVPVLEGTDDLSLNRGVGRIAGTAQPGESGNFGIAGHRDGFFRGLKDIRNGDLIQVRTLDTTYVYTVEDLKVVEPDDVSVLRNREQPTLTLVTCYPFYFVGPAPQRFIVTASLTSVEGRIETSQNLSRQHPNTNTNPNSIRESKNAKKN